MALSVPSREHAPQPHPEPSLALTTFEGIDAVASFSRLRRRVRSHRAIEHWAAKRGALARMEFVARDDRVGDMSNEFAHAMKR